MKKRELTFASKMQKGLRKRQKYIQCIYKIFAMAVGKALVLIYYLEVKSLKQLSSDLEKIDRLLAKGVRYFSFNRNQKQQTHPESKR